MGASSRPVLFDRGFTGLLELLKESITSIDASEVIGLTPWIEAVIASSTIYDLSNAVEDITDIIGVNVLGDNGVIAVFDDNSGETTLSLDVEYTQDMIAGFLVGGTNITLTYNDLLNTLTIDAATLPDEHIQDVVGAMISGTNGVTAVYDDNLGTETLSLDMEYVQDQLNSFLQPGNAIALTYNDVGNTLTIAYSPTQTQYDFNDNTTLVVVIGNAVTERAVIFDYTLEIIGGYQVGNVQIVHDGTTAAFRHEFVGVPTEIKKVTYAATVVGNDIRFSITANAVGSNLKLKITNRSALLKTV